MAARKKVDRNPEGKIAYNAFFTIGCDPEIFLTDAKGKVVGSEKVIPKKGLWGGYGNSNGVVRDGVQMEIHPVPTTCRANVGNAIQTALQELRSKLNEPEFKGKFKVSFADVVEVSKKELASLSPECRVLGCMPSLNLYRPSAIRVNPVTYRKRSGGGHIHMSSIPAGMLSEPKKVRNLILMFDIFAGNTCVLIDRSPLAATRRRVYGRAGEYRLPKHGVEYRTLSNFWMHAYPLFSLVAALCRMGASASYTTHQLKGGVTAYQKQYVDLEGIVLDTMDIKRVQRAINKNDLDLALQNWEDLKPIIKRYYGEGAWDYEGIGNNNIDKFEYFAKKIQEHSKSETSKANGLDYWWDHDPFKHWCNKAEGHGTGWESFLIKKVEPAMAKEAAEAKKAAEAPAITPVVEEQVAVETPEGEKEKETNANPDQAAA